MLLSCGASPTRRSAGEGGARVFRVERAAQLIDGPMAEGAVGDWRLENERIAVIVSNRRRPTGFARSGGNVIDAARRDERGDAPDEFRHLTLYLNAKFPGDARYEQEAVEGDGRSATLVVRGYDLALPEVAIETRYEMISGATSLRVRTRATNRGRSAIANYRIGDVVQWGATEHFAPGLGTKFRGRQDVPWLAGAGEGSAYGYVGPPTSRLVGEHGSSWSDVTVAAGNLAPAGSLEAVRHLAIGGPGGVGAVLDELLRLRGETFGTLLGRVAASGDGRPVPRALLRIESLDGAPASNARTDAHGRYATALPPGEFRVMASAPGRGAAAASPASIAAGSESRLDAVLGPGGALDFEITEGGLPLPVKLAVVGIPPTPDPELGPRYRADGAGNVVLARHGKGSIPLAAGHYRVIATRGPEYDAAEAEVEVEPGRPVALRAALRRVVDTRGYISADLHQHALPSPDSAVALRDRVLSNAAAGVEVLVATDHDFFTDFAPIIAAMDLAAHVVSIPGDEATTTSGGHFNVFPVSPRPDRPRNGAFSASQMTGKEVLDHLAAFPSPKFVQVNHPRAGRLGYLNAVGYDPVAAAIPENMSLSFDAIEVLNGKRLSALEPALRDWFSLLGRGLRVVATGNSDTHAIFGEEVGYPRNFIAVRDDTPARIAAAELVAGLRERRDSQLSTGPFLRVAILGNPVGSLVRTRGDVDVAVEVQAAPWVDVTTLEVWRNGQLVATRPVPPSSAATRFRGEISIRVDRDASIVVIARGARPLAPYVSADPEIAATPIAIVNPIWVDADGNGRFAPPGVAALPSR